MRDRFVAGAGVVALALAQGAVADEFDCGSLKNHYGPFSYTNPTHVAEKLPVVEQYHMHPNVLQLKPQPGKSRVTGDLDYILRAFPNHHLALDAMARYQLEVPWRPNYDYRSAECYFDRAMRFAPNDGRVRHIYGLYLYRKGAKTEALTRYQEAVELSPDSAELHYHIGLLYFELRRYDEAQVHAEQAYELGYPLPGLRNKLARVGRG